MNKDNICVGLELEFSNEVTHGWTSDPANKKDKDVRDKEVSDIIRPWKELLYAKAKNSKDEITVSDPKGRDKWLLRVSYKKEDRDGTEHSLTWDITTDISVIEVIIQKAPFKYYNFFRKLIQEHIYNFAKKLAECHLSRRSRIKINFENLTAEEFYTEIATIKDLPEMYTVTNYFLGRNFIYQKDIVLAKKYFELAKYLGKKFELFEGFLSIRGGLVIIKGDEIETIIKAGDLKKAKKEILECINIYEDLRKDDRKYKINYRPNNFNPTIIVPKEDIYNVIDCSKRILKLYTKLIEIIDDAHEQNNCLNAVSMHLIGSGSLPGVLEKIKGITDDSARIAADLYNNLGYFLLKLYDKKIAFGLLKNNIIEKLNLTDGSDLEILYQIFDLAKSLSRSTEFSKADAYDGLAEICKRMITQPNITEKEKSELSIKIREFKDGRDAINKQLGRIVAKS